MPFVQQILFVSFVVGTLGKLDLVSLNNLVTGLYEPLMLLDLFDVQRIAVL